MGHDNPPSGESRNFNWELPAELDFAGDPGSEEHRVTIATLDENDIAVALVEDEEDEPEDEPDDDEEFEDDEDFDDDDFDDEDFLDDEDDDDDYDDDGFEDEDDDDY